MNRRLGTALTVLAVVIVVVAGPVVYDLFAPERSTTVVEAGPGDGATTLATGTFSGADAAHRVSGTVSLVEEDGTHVLYFQNYSQTQGPDVFVYLTPDGDPTTRDQIDRGVKVRIDGGADGGESTKEGTFRQELPGDIDPTQYRGVSVWCDDFSVPFGSATLTDE
ncbi:DM13 domain-containing protein [Halomarina salina]|uniref:DM13 domain-containing protein n=1 Tax=Halomarina salina TaxID=1872699 RepID=A0ABD5RPQ4_9EURY|nr:DM13 domain-containing protein [Halomarina salina]